MPAPHRSLTTDEVRRFVAQRCFATSADRVGAEVEWLTVPADNPRAHVSFATLREVVDRLGPLPGRSVVTYEPGGQLELSSPPGNTPNETCDGIATDERVIRRELEAAGIALAGIGLDPLRAEDRRVLHLPRYAAMEAYFDGSGPEGRRMMCRTAAVQVNVDSGTGDEATRRWQIAHAIGPVLAAMFANSPLLEGRPTGWHSTRLATWWAMDRTRTAPAAATNPVEAWTRYVLASRVMFVRSGDGWYEPVGSRFTFADWMTHGHVLGYPTMDDLVYHGTTLFPPVRPRGWLEMRMIDALPDPWWRVAVAVTAALILDERASETAREACGRTSAMWVTASRCALEDASLARAAKLCMSAALDVLPRIGAGGTTTAAAHAFADRYTFRGRSPSVDLLESRTVAELEPAWT